MSSTSAPYGFRPSFHNSGQIRPKAYTITSTYAASIFSGDPVKLTSDGVIQLWVNQIHTQLQIIDFGSKWLYKLQIVS